MKSLSLWHAQLLPHCFRAAQLEKDRHIVKIDKRIDILHAAISYGKLLYAHNWFLFVSISHFLTKIPINSNYRACCHLIILQNYLGIHHNTYFSQDLSLLFLSPSFSSSPQLQKKKKKKKGTKIKQNKETQN